MMTDLKPCPLCGSTDIACFAEECGDDYDNVPTFRAVVGCRGCHEEGCDQSYDDEPCFGIEAYFRADHPLVSDCEDPSDCERILERHMADRWNRRVERTCHADLTESNEPANINTWECSSCGKSFEEAYGSYEYCPHCGGRIVEERR